MSLSALDAEQVLQSSYNANGSLNVSSLAEGLVPAQYDSIALTYVSSGAAAGQVATVSYYAGGLSGTLIQTLTLSYNGSAQLTSVVGSVQV